MVSEAQNKIEKKSETRRRRRRDVRVKEIVEGG